MICMGWANIAEDEYVVKHTMPGLQRISCEYANDLMFFPRSNSSRRITEYCYAQNHIHALFKHQRSSPTNIFRNDLSLRFERARTGEIGRIHVRFAGRCSKFNCSLNLKQPAYVDCRKTCTTTVRRSDVQFAKFLRSLDQSGYRWITFLMSFLRCGPESSLSQALQRYVLRVCV